MTGTCEDVINWLMYQDRNELFDIEIHSDKKSNAQNRLLWECFGRMAIELKKKKWDVYLEMLKRYGKFVYVCMLPEAVDYFKEEWREVEEIGTMEIGGQEYAELHCYYGLSKLNKRECSVLIEGVISEMKEMGIPTPDGEVERVLRQLEEEKR